MEWTKNKGIVPSVSHYDHIILMTPIGDFIIEWKSWKENPSYDITFRDTEWISSEYSLEDAKEVVLKYIINKKNKLIEFLN